LEFFLLQSPSFWRPSTDFSGHLDHELTLVGLDRAILHKNLGELSSGQTQRLLVAWAMLLHPGVLVLDEPTAGVDIGFEETIYSLIRRVQTERGTTVLLISHDLSVAYRYAQKVLCLNKSVVCQGPPVEALKPEALSILDGDTGYFRHDTDAREASTTRAAI
jgi:zinc transport system ATP-binding protein